MTLPLLSMLLPMPVFADIGPKPSVQLTFAGIEETPYYVTLLSQDDSTGPYWLADRDAPIPDYAVETAVDRAAWQAFRDYEDPDGFYFIEYAKECSGSNTFRWGYYPPQVFKVLLYLPESGRYMVSGIYERYAFDSYFTVTAAPDGSLSLRKSYDYSWEIISLLARMAATVSLELLLALVFGYRKKMVLGVIAVTNLVTQGILNLLLNLFNYRSGSWAFVFHYIWMELAVIVIEAVVFSVLFKKLGADESRKPVGYAVTANILSFIAGLLIAKAVPGIF